MRLTTVFKIITKTLFNSILVIYSWTGLLPKFPGYLNYVRVTSSWAIDFASNSWSTWNHFLSIDHTLVPGILKFQNYYPWPHIEQAYTDSHAYLFLLEFFSEYALAIILIPLKLYLGKFQFLEWMIFNQDIPNFEDNNFFVCNNRLTSLLEGGELNVMRKTCFQFLNFA
jgi:hypothetical protein